MPFRIRGLELHKAIWADMKAARPAIFQPERPKGDEARIVGTSPVWAEYDVALHSDFLARLYKAQGDWPRAAEMDAQAAQYYKELVEHNPTVATFTKALAAVLNDEIDATEQENNRQQAAAWSKDAVAFWNRQMDLHPDVPDITNYADDAAKRMRRSPVGWRSRPPRRRSPRGRSSSPACWSLAAVTASEREAPLTRLPSSPTKWRF
jgi:hypothetical protein